MQIIQDSEMTPVDAPSIKWMLVRDAVSMLWQDNPKLHDMGSLVQSIEKYGLQELPKFDATLGAIKAGNGRVQALRSMEMNKRPLPRGCALTAAGEWVMPVLFGTDADSIAQAAAYAIDSNNLTMAGGDFSPFDMAKMWNEGYLAVLNTLANDGEFSVSVDGDALDTMARAVDDPLGEWKGMPEMGMENKAYRSIMVHFKDANDVQKFIDILGMAITDKTTYIWFNNADESDS